MGHRCPAERKPRWRRAECRVKLGGCRAGDCSCSSRLFRSRMQLGRSRTRWSMTILVSCSGSCRRESTSREKGRIQTLVYEWWPARTNCRYDLIRGGTVLVKGDAEVFYSAFAFWVIVGILVLAPIRGMAARWRGRHCWTRVPRLHLRLAEWRHPLEARAASCGRSRA